MSGGGWRVTESGLTATPNSVEHSSGLSSFDEMADIHEKLLDLVTMACEPAFRAPPKAVFDKLEQPEYKDLAWASMQSVEEDEILLPEHHYFPIAHNEKVIACESSMYMMTCLDKFWVSVPMILLPLWLAGLALWLNTKGAFGMGMSGEENDDDDDAANDTTDRVRRVLSVKRVATVFGHLTASEIARDRDTSIALCVSVVVLVLFFKSLHYYLYGGWARLGSPDHLTHKQRPSLGALAPCSSPLSSPAAPPYYHTPLNPPSFCPPPLLPPQCFARAACYDPGLSSPPRASSRSLW